MHKYPGTPFRQRRIKESGRKPSVFGSERTSRRLPLGANLQRVSDGYVRFAPGALRARQPRRFDRRAIPCAKKSDEMMLGARRTRRG